MAIGIGVFQVFYLIAITLWVAIAIPTLLTNNLDWRPVGRIGVHRIGIEVSAHGATQRIGTAD